MVMRFSGDVFFEKSLIVAYQALDLLLRKLEFTCRRMVLHEFNKPMFVFGFEKFS